MILKASQRGGGQDLAAHLMKMDDNEHVLLHELKGFASDNLKDAFKEIEAISRGTRCKQYLFSLSLSPPEQESVSEEQFEAAIERIEGRLGLEGQPRAVVFHEKEGRRHAHCVWSRIDAQTMTARQMSFFKQKLMGISRDLYLDQGWAMPRGIIEAGARDPTNFTLAEWQQAKRAGLDPRWLKVVVQDSWNRSDSTPAFSGALQDRGLFLAKGDRRSHVVIDFSGEVHALPRCLGLNTKQVRARLGDGDDLPSVDATKEQIAGRMTLAMRRHVAEGKTRFKKGAAVLAHRKMELVLRQRDERLKLASEQKRRWLAETKERRARLPIGLRGLWSKITGKYQAIRAENEAQAERTRRQIARERQLLVQAQRDERASLQVEIKAMRKRQAEQLLELRSDIVRFLKFKRSQDAGLSRERNISLSLRLDR
ncbi:relaxase/mobilization nuclease domain-containing protein [Mesorhizobium liriopis]